MAENSSNNFNDSTNFQIFNLNLRGTVWIYGIRVSHNIILVNRFSWWKFIIFHLCVAQLWIAVYSMSESVKKSQKYRTTKLWVIYAVTMVSLKFRLHLMLLQVEVFNMVQPKYLELIRHAWLTRYNLWVAYWSSAITCIAPPFRWYCLEKYHVVWTKLPKITKNKLENK